MLILRLREYIDYKGINISAFERSVGLSNNSIRRKIETANNNMGTDMLHAILSAYPELSADWLLLGIGKMLRGSDGSSDEPKTNEADINEMMQIIKQQQQTISELTKAITTLIENSNKK